MQNGHIALRLDAGLRPQLLHGKKRSKQRTVTSALRDHRREFEVDDRQHTTRTHRERQRLVRLQKVAQLLGSEARSLQDASEQAARYVSASVHRDVSESAVVSFEDDVRTGCPVKTKARTLESAYQPIRSDPRKGGHGVRYCYAAG